MNRTFTYFIVGAMVLGVVVGFACHELLSPTQVTQVTGVFQLMTDLFLRLIKMIIAPLVFATLVSGIAHMEDAATVGRIGLKSILWFIAASIVSLTIGLLMVHALQPGVGLSLSAAASGASSVDTSSFTLHDFVLHLVPSSIFDAMATNSILQIVVFSLFVGTAVSSLEDRAPAVLTLVENIAQIMLRVTGYVMRLAPIAIFAALASTVAHLGLTVLGTYARFVGGFYLSMGILWAVLIAVGVGFVGPRLLRLISLIRAPILLAFSTASSEAALPRTLEQLQTFGISRRVASFVLPLGYSFNLDGSMMYCTFATLFIAQAYHIPLSIGQQVLMLLILMVTSKGMAGVPRASLVVIQANLLLFGLPESGMVLILGVDALLDMGRSATNVVGNSVASAVVARWENQLGPEVALAPAAPAAAAE